MTAPYSQAEAAAPPQVFRGVVQAVYPDRWVVDVEIEDKTGAVWTDIPIAATALSPSGAGVYTMPEVDSECLVMQTGADAKILLCFVARGDEGPDFNNGRPPLEPGDIYLGTVDQNSVILRRGGMIEIGASPLSKRVYMPLDNMIVDYWQNYKALAPMGEVFWQHATVPAHDGPIPLPDDDYDLATVIGYSFKRTTGEDVTAGRYNVELRIGKLDADNLDADVDAEHLWAQATDEDHPTSPIDAVSNISITVFDPDPDAQAVTWALQVSKEGDEFRVCAGEVHHEYRKSVYARVGENATLEVGGSAAVSVGEVFTVDVAGRGATPVLLVTQEIWVAIRDSLLTHNHGDSPANIPANAAAIQTAFNAAKASE